MPLSILLLAFCCGACGGEVKAEGEIFRLQPEGGALWMQVETVVGDDVSKRMEHGGGGGGRPYSM